MKTVLTLLLGIVTGVVLVYAWQGYQYQKLRYSSGEALEIYTIRSVDSQSFYHEYSRSLYVEDLNSKKKYEITFYPREGGVVDYAWKSQDDESEHGEGSVFEKYETKDFDLEEFSVEVEDVGGSLSVSVGQLALDWSAASRVGGWISYNPGLASLSIQVHH